MSIRSTCVAAPLAMLVLAAAAVSPALAHAELVSSLPAADSTASAPAELRLDFSEALELAFSKVTVIGPDGATIATEPPMLDATDPSLLVVPMGTAVPPGVITVEWKAVAADGHALEGSYSFTVTP